MAAVMMAMVLRLAACGVNGGGYGCSDVVDRGSVSAAVLLQVFNSFQAS
jgi:hypothetical protein